MDIDASRVRLRKITASLDALIFEAESKATVEADSKNELKDDIDNSLFSKMVRGITTLSWRSAISMNEAWKGLVAAKQVIVRLANATNDYDEIDSYNDALEVIQDELTRMVNADWQSRTKVYKPYTTALASAAGNLKTARDRAVALAGSLNFAANLLGAFGKLLGAL
jgi:hypothetical protein